MRMRSFLLAGALAGGAGVSAGQAWAASTSDILAAQQAQLEALKEQVKLLEGQLKTLRVQAEKEAAVRAQAPAKPSPRVVQSSTNRFSIESADGQYSIALTGVFQFDVGSYLNFHPDSKFVGPGNLSSGVNARRARIGVTGKAAGDWNYTFVYDAGNSSDATARGIEAAQISYTGFKDLAIDLGYSNTFFTLDQATSSSDILFLERSSAANVATNINTGDNRSNAGARYFTDRYWLGAYFTGPSASSDSHTLTAERIGAFQRATFQVLQSPDYTLHVGVSADELIKTSNSGVNTPYALTLSDQPALRIDPTTLLNTGSLGSLANPVTGATVYDAEIAGNYRNFYFQGEYLHYEVDRRGLATASFDGGYGELSWTITGESHKYVPASGTYSRITPAHPFSLKDGTWGAWEIAARVDYVNLNDNFIAGRALSGQPAAIDGGRQTDYTVALNWYPNTALRFMLDYIHTDYDKANPTAVLGAQLGAPVGAQFDALALRTQVTW
jgi:phosphate-selective porin OprO/OprP